VPNLRRRQPAHREVLPQVPGFARRESRVDSPHPASYTPKHLADKILTSRSALEGERKQVTVLFADVKGSMELAEQVDPEEWHTILDRFFQILADGVHRFEGTVNIYTGDSIMGAATPMSCGCAVASTDLSQRLDAEDLRSVVRVYQEAASQAI
jgi:class 3 adenylate cyclase